MTTSHPAVALALWAACHEVDAAPDPLDAELRALTGAEPPPEHPLRTWRSLGERHVLVALPAPGRPGMLPRGTADFRDAALAAGECLVAASLGGALVPVDGAEPDAPLVWEPWDAEPLDVRRVLARDPGQARQELNVAVDGCLARLEAVDETALADLRDALLERTPPLPLPAAVPPRLAGLVDLAARVLDVAELRHDPRIGAMSAHGTRARELALEDLGYVAREALETATNAAVLHLARQR